jgi:hypothetical protein
MKFSSKLNAPLESVVTVRGPANEPLQDLEKRICVIPVKAQEKIGKTTKSP